MSRPFLDKNIAIKNIVKLINKINEKNNHEADISFLGFFEDKWIGRNTKLILKCKKHNCVWDTTRYCNLHSLKNNGCPICSEEIKIQSSSYTPEEALQKVLILHKNDGRNYDYLKILNTFTGYNNEVTITCPIHGDFRIRYSTLLLSKNKNRKEIGGICPKCLEENNKRRLKEAEVLDKIYNRILEIKNEFGTELEFLGFVGGKYINSKTRLILKCKIHNKIWDTTQFKTFIYNKRGPVCTICSSRKNKVSKPEKYCYECLLNYVNKSNIFSQFELRNVIDKDLKIIRKVIYLDIKTVINNKTLIIEFDGNQHTDFIKYFHRSYQDYINQVNRDNFVEEYCKEQGWILLRIPWIDRKRIPEIIKAFFEEGKDITTKVEPKLLPILYGQDIVN